MFLNIQKQTLNQWKEALLSFLVALICFFLAYSFPTNDYAQTLTKNIFFLIAVPFLYIKLVLKKDFRDFGVNLDRKKEGSLWGLAMFFCLAVLFFLIIRYTGFARIYAPPAFIKINFGHFLFYELILINLLFLMQEIFFKGFLLSALRERLGYGTILIQPVAILLSLLILNASFIKNLPTLALSLLGGYVAYKSRSFVYAYFFGLVFLILLDAYLIFINL